jgi:hypothetical protein
VVTGNNVLVSSRLLVVRLIVVAGLLAGMALSLPLWLTRTDYPRVPAFDFIPALPRPLDIALLIAFGVALVVPFVRPAASRWVIILFGISALLMLEDQSRLQPWFIEYLLLLAALAFSQNEKTALNTCSLILAIVYFWSGVHKMNTSFTTVLFPWLISPFVQSSASSAVRYIGGSMPFVEMAFGLSLLGTRTRRFGVMAILAMHTFLIVMLSPLALGWNSVVLPWNVAMVVLVPFLFWHSPASAKELLTVRQAYWIPLLILPVLSLCGIWDTNPSFALYSGNPMVGSVVISRDATDELPPSLRALAEPFGDLYRVRLDDWSVATMNVPGYPAERVLRKVAQSFCSLHAQNRDAIFVLEQPPAWFYRDGWHKIEAREQFCRH